MEKRCSAHCQRFDFAADDKRTDEDDNACCIMHGAVSL